MTPNDAGIQNIDKLQRIAAAMGHVKRKGAFLGGTILPFLLQQKIPLGFRKSKDVDFIVDAPTKQHLYEFEDVLHEQGFINLKVGSVCKWSYDDLTVDILPHDKVVDFNNAWFDKALPASYPVDIGRGLVVDIIPAHYFLGIKMTGFYRRGYNNYAGSFDIYDMLLILMGRPTIEQEIITLSDTILRTYLHKELSNILQKRDDLLLLINKFSPQSTDLEPQISKMFSRIERIVQCS